MGGLGVVSQSLFMFGANKLDSPPKFISDRRGEKSRAFVVHMLTEKFWQRQRSGSGRAGRPQHMDARRSRQNVKHYRPDDLLLFLKYRVESLSFFMWRSVSDLVTFMSRRAYCS